MADYTDERIKQLALEALSEAGVDAMSDDPAQGGVDDIDEGELQAEHKMLLLDPIAALWKKAALTSVANKIDNLLLLMHDAERVAELPIASAATMRRIYMVPARRVTEMRIDWANDIPRLVRGVSITGTDAQGTIQGDNGTYGLVVGPAEAGNYVSFSVLQDIDTFVTVGSGVMLMLTAQAEGDVLDITFTGNTSAYCTLNGQPLASDQFRHIITAEEVTAGYIRLVTTGTVKIASIRATYSGTNAATGYDPQRTLYDKYMTVAEQENNMVVYRWEQIGSAYIDMSGFYNKSEIGILLSALADRLLTTDNNYTGNDTHTGSTSWVQNGKTITIGNSKVNLGREQVSYNASLSDEELQMSYLDPTTHQTIYTKITANGVIISDGANFDTLNFAKLSAVSSLVADVQDMQVILDDILEIIPETASASNKLADVNFVNSSIASAAATHRGTFNLVSDLNLPVNATRAQIANKLSNTVSVATKNDYVFVQIPTSEQTPNEIANVDRYKYNGTNWGYEYSLNNSSFTAAQWAAINSGITSTLVGKLTALPTAAQLNTAFGGKLDTITQEQFDAIFD